jgi:NOL1/NOP2/fmu family ribosome biogenesis protein
MEIEWLTKHLRVISAGTFMAAIKHDKIIPEHALALSVEINHSNFPALPLTYDDAIHFLKKENISVPSGEKGFSLVTYNGLPLGWVNMLPNRINNLYPPEWRIRMR